MIAGAFPLFGQLIFEGEDNDEHEDENPGKKSKIPNCCTAYPYI